MIDFLGTGSAFNTKLDNTSAFIRNADSLILIDCGGTIFKRIRELNIFEGLKNLYIVITHSHPDHIGSLGDTIFYAHYILKIKPTIFFPNKELLEDILVRIGVKTEMYQFNSAKTAKINDAAFEGFKIEFLTVTHSGTVPSFGFIMSVEGKSFYYSGDAKNIDKKIIDKLKAGEIIRIYQDTCGLDFEGNSHLSLKKLCEIIPKEYRNKVYCMHLDEHITEDDIINNGFNAAERINKINVR